MFKNKIELKNTLINWLYETIDEYYSDEIDEIVDDNSDKIYEIIENLVGDQLYINWSRYEYILDFYTEDEINEIVDWLGIDRNDTYEILFRIFDDLLCEDVEDVRNYYKPVGNISTKYLENEYYKLDYTNRIVIIDKEVYLDEYQDIKYRLLRASGGFGCSPTALGRQVYYTNLYDDEHAHCRREHIAGVIKKEYENEVIEKYINTQEVK